MVFSYGGLLFDLLIGFMLINRRTRLLALPLLLFFHLLNAFLFNIGVFPWLMIASTVVFFAPDFPERLFRLSRGKSSEKDREDCPGDPHRRCLPPGPFGTPLSQPQP